MREKSKEVQGLLDGAVPACIPLPACILPHPMSLRRILTETKNIVACWLTSTSVFLPGLLQNLAM